MKKHGTRGIRGSLSAKMNIMIVIIILTVSVMLVTVSAVTYRETVFHSRETALNGIEMPTETLSPNLEHFLQVFDTEEFKEVRAREDRAMETESDEGFMTKWMNDTPGRDPDNPNEDSVLMEWFDVSMWVDDFWENQNLNSLFLEVSKDRTVYRIDARFLNNYLSYNYRSSDFGRTVPYFPEYSAEEFSSAAITRSGNWTLYVRCVRFGLNGGGEARAWMILDMTEATQAYRKFLLTSILIVLGLTTVIICVTMLLLRRNLVRPIQEMAQATENFQPEEDGTYSAGRISRVAVPGADELSGLSHAIRSMQRQIVENTGNLARMAAERERINTEMNLARTIQASALPSVFPAFPDRREFDLYASMTPAREVGGDFYDFFLTDGDHLAMVIADVSGKGVPAALFMMEVKTLIRNYMAAGNTPAQAMERVNLQICGNNPSRMFLTVWLAVLDVSTGKGLACNAGHEDPCLRSAGAQFERLEYEHDIVAGIFTNAAYHDRTFEMRPGDCIFVYTDGVPEAHNGAGELFGTGSLVSVLNRKPEAEPEELIRRVHGELDRFSDGTPRFDDVTMLCLQYHG